MRSHKGTHHTQYVDSGPWRNTGSIPGPFKTRWRMTFNQPYLPYKSHLALIFCLSLCPPQHAALSMSTQITELCSLQRTLLIRPLIHCLQHLWDTGRVISPFTRGEVKPQSKHSTDRSGNGAHIILLHIQHSFESGTQPQIPHVLVLVCYMWSGSKFLELGEHSVTFPHMRSPPFPPQSCLPLLGP